MRHRLAIAGLGGDADDGAGVGARTVPRQLRLSAGHNKVILHSVPSKEAFYERFGFRRMTPAMAIFENPEAAFAKGYISTP